MKNSNISNKKNLKEALKKIKELEDALNLLKCFNDKNELLNFPWVGNLGNWCWFVETNKVYCNEGKLKAIGYCHSDLKEEIGYEFFTEKLHPDDFNRVMENMKSHLMGESPAYEVEYRIKAKDGSYKWFYDRGKITKKTVDGKPALLAGIVFDITRKKELELELKKANQKLRELATKDELTNCFNKNTLKNKLESEILKFKRYNNFFSIIMFDIDFFKKVNDTFGHKAGDDVLKEIAYTAKERIRKTDYIGRWGGEEFLIVLSNTNLNEACVLAENLRKSFESKKINNQISVTASFGVTTILEDDDILSLFKRVDSLMYQAKNKGRNNVVSG